MLWFKCFVYPEVNLCIKNITKHRKSRPDVFRLFHVSVANNRLPEKNEMQKIATYRKIAEKEKLDLNNFLIQPQDQDEVENIFKEIAQGDDEVENQLRLLMYEIMIKREEEEQMPNRLNKNNWEILLKLQTLSKRNKYLNFLYKTEKKKESGKIKDALKKRDCELIDGLYKNHPHIYYGLGGYSLFMRIYPKTLLPIQNLKILTNKLFAPPIIFDCSYEKYMNDIKSKYCARQIALSILLNRLHPYPCTLQLFNLKDDDLLMEQLKACRQKLEVDKSQCEIYKNSYLDMYPKERLVYLTPHTKHYLNEVRSDNIYIIGAFVDKGDGVQVSLAKAKEEGLRMAKLPLDKYLLWRKGTKSLTLNNVLSILLDLRYYRNWKKALQSIPIRNLTER